MSDSAWDFSTSCAAIAPPTVRAGARRCSTVDRSARWPRATGAAAVSRSRATLRGPRMAQPPAATPAPATSADGRARPARSGGGCRGAAAQDSAACEPPAVATPTLSIPGAAEASRRRRPAAQGSGAGGRRLASDPASRPGRRDADRPGRHAKAGTSPRDASWERDADLGASERSRTPDAHVAQLGVGRRDAHAGSPTDARASPTTTASRLSGRGRDRRGRDRAAPVDPLTRPPRDSPRTVRGAMELLRRAATGVTSARAAECSPHAGGRAVDARIARIEATCAIARRALARPGTVTAARRALPAAVAVRRP